jgi:hypothetical protein
MLLLISTLRKWTFPHSTYDFITTNRASTQLIVTLLSDVFALVYTAVIVAQINRAARLYWKRHGASLDTLRQWNAICTRSMFWELPVSRVLFLIIFIAATSIPSAIWTGALTPVFTSMQSVQSLRVPGYQNTSALHGYPGEIGSEGPIVRNAKGLFTYSVGMLLQGSLLAGASAATTVDGSVRKHAKIDYSQFTYFGRSYGIGAATGLTDNFLAHDTLQTSYSYEETGLDTIITCAYNSSSNFIIVKDADTFLYEAEGTFPNSLPDHVERSTYVGHNSDAIVAIAAANEPADERRIMAIAAGKSYQHLDKAQCNFTFTPTRFNVNVSLVGQNISVTPLNKIGSFPDMSNITNLVLAQIAQISVDQTNLYVSLLGSSLNSSISDCIAAYNGSGPLSLEDATMPGLENALTSMADDILVALASAQLVIQNDTETVNIEVTSVALRPGDAVYIYAIFAVNTALLILLTVEIVRTSAWRHLAVPDFADPAILIMATLSGAQCAKEDSLKSGCTDWEEGIGMLETSLSEDNVLQLGRKSLMGSIKMGSRS